jgi:uncharacterized repeat protein (TIGR03803 family)
MYLLLRITSIALATSSILSAAAANDVLHTFQGTTDGLFPEYPLITDTHGNLFGVTILGGSRGQGTVFELSPNNGGYSYRQLYAFQGYPGASTPTGPLVMDSAGNLYGTAGGGPYSSFPYGTIFELSPTAGGDWSEKVIYNFPPVSYAPSQPTGGLVIDANGNLYGVSQKGGTRYSGGTVFELSPNENGVWAIKVLYKFNGSYNAGGDGYDPIGGLTFDTAGNLYGTTYYGGTDQQGVVFQLSPQTDGTWAETVLHSFIGRDGCNPASAVVLDKSGNVYGTTSVLSEAYTTTCESQGTVFELSPSETGWKETVLYLFRNGTHEGQYPNGVILDNNGNLYGTTLLAGLYGYGVIFELTPQPTGMGTLKIIYNFTGGADGGTPKGGVIFGIDGNLYGTTNSYGGTDGSGRGTVFRQNP